MKIVCASKFDCNADVIQNDELVYLTKRLNNINFGVGWERMVLQILFLGPSNLLEPNASFAQMSQKLIVSPIVKTLVFSKVPEKVSKLI